MFDMFGRPFSTVDQLTRDMKRPRIMPPQEGFPPSGEHMLGEPGMATEDIGQVGPSGMAPPMPEPAPRQQLPMPAQRVNTPLDGEIMPPGADAAPEPVDGRAMLLETGQALLKFGSPAQKIQGMQMLFEAQQPTPAEKEEYERGKLRSAIEGADADDKAKRRALLGVELGAKPDDVLEAIGFDATGQKAELEKKQKNVKYLQELAGTEYTNSVLRKSADVATQLIDKGWQPTTGTAGYFAAKIPGSAASQLETALKPIRAIIGFDRLQQMKNESQSGGALGQVAVQELQFLQATAGALDITQDPEILKANIADVIKGKELLTEMRKLVPLLEEGEPGAMQAYMQLSKQLGAIGAEAQYRSQNFGGNPQQPGQETPAPATEKPKMTTTEILRRAQQAIAEGKDEAAIMKRLQEWGVDLGAR